MTEPSRAQLSADEARALFDAALDGELASDEQRSFDEALARDEVLRAEYERWRSLSQTTAELGRVSQVDLLAGVQHKLRARSGGKFYRDRFAERVVDRGRGRGDGLRVLILLSACLVIGVLLWFAYDAGLLFKLQ